jgi:hypothetical protein
MRGLDGVAIWCSGGRSGSDGFDTRDGYDDGITWCGNGKTRIPTKRFEAFREGLEDIAYMDALAKEIAKAKIAKRDVSKAQALLDKRAEVMEKANYDVLDQWRLEAGRAIHELIKGMNGSKGKLGNSSKNKASKK